MKIENSETSLLSDFFATVPSPSILSDMERTSSQTCSGFSHTDLLSIISLFAASNSCLNSASNS